MTNPLQPELQGVGRTWISPTGVVAARLNLRLGSAAIESKSLCQSQAWFC
ncbi:hypothetical protein ACQ4M3_29145 [Leptolyngbya sp. AN03gr2]